MKTKLLAAAMVLLTGTPAVAHRLDEYLQGTILSIEKNRVDAQVALTPGVAIFPIVIAAIDRNGDGVISETEQRVYAGRVLRELWVAIDGRALTPRLVSAQFPPIADMKEGRGEIRIAFDVDLPSGGARRKLTFENRHLSAIAAYQVNCLVPHDPDIRISAQNRNYSQSLYELDFVQTGAASNTQTLTSLAGSTKLLGTIALVVFASLAFERGRHF